jgi:hypothetical protein
VLIYVAIMAVRLGKIERDFGELLRGPDSPAPPAREGDGSHTESGLA